MKHQLKPSLSSLNINAYEQLDGSYEGGIDVYGFYDPFVENSNPVVGNCGGTGTFAGSINNFIKGVDSSQWVDAVGAYKASIELAKEKGLLKASEGAQVVDLEAYDMPPCIIITSAGTTIYATRDLAALLYRIDTYDFTKALYVVGSEQQLHFKQIFKVYRKL